MLRRWRDARGLSQLGLSIESGVTQKHISFVETSRSVPSRQLLMQLARVLDIPLRERNALLLAAGFAPAYSQAPLEARGMEKLHSALQCLLRKQEPFPAIMVDRHWNVLASNDGAKRFFNCFVDLDARHPPRNILHLMFDPQGLRPFITNWRQASQGLLARVKRESVGHVMDEGTLRLIDELGRYPVVEAPADDAQDLDSPVIPLKFRKDGTVLNYFSLVTTVGTPQTVAAQELRVECMFPTDETTERDHLQFLASHAKAPYR
jgi:transcriptional regulator with XRE-family HTH domain